MKETKIEVNHKMVEDDLNNFWLWLPFSEFKELKNITKKDNIKMIDTNKNELFIEKRIENNDFIGIWYQADFLSSKKDTTFYLIID